MQATRRWGKQVIAALLWSLAIGLPAPSFAQPPAVAATPAPAPASSAAAKPATAATPAVSSPAAAPSSGVAAPSVVATPAAPGQSAVPPAGVTPQARQAAPAAPDPSPASAVSSPAPASAASPALVSPGSEQLHLPTQSDRQALAEWKKNGAVGKSTFVDKIRTMTWTLAFICFVVWLVGKFVGKNTLQKFGMPVEPSTLIEVIEKKRLSPGRSIMLLRVGPKVLAVAVTESGFRTLTEIDSELLKQYQDEVGEVDSDVASGPLTQGPADIAKHYLSIIPGLGVKK